MRISSESARQLHESICATRGFDRVPGHETIPVGRKKRCDRGNLARGACPANRGKLCGYLCYHLLIRQTGKFGASSADSRNHVVGPIIRVNCTASDRIYEYAVSCDFERQDFVKLLIAALST